MTTHCWNGAFTLAARNTSFRLPGADRFLLTGSTLNNFDPAELTRLNLDGRVLAGSMDTEPQEIVQMHTVDDRRQPDVGAVIDTHSPHAMAFAIANRPLPPAYEAPVRFDVTASVPVAAYGPRGAARSISNIVGVITGDTKIVLVANNGGSPSTRTSHAPPVGVRPRRSSRDYRAGRSIRRCQADTGSIDQGDALAPNRLLRLSLPHIAPRHPV